VVYSTVTMESVGALFMAGFAPGIAIALGLMIVALFFALRDNHPRRKERLAKGEALRTTRKSLLALLAPVILVGGIFSGQFTPTEAAAVACAYVLFVGVFIFRTLGWNEIFESLKVTAVTSSVILFIISIATVFATMLTLERIPAHIAHYILSLTGNKYIFLLLVNIFLLFVGMIMETGVSVILLAPILLPVATRLGIHPLHFALVMLVNLNIGLNTPPLGVCLYVAAPIAKIRFEKIARAAVPFIAIQIVVLMIITYIPEIILFLPRLFGYIT
jgi:tripartite ATP-independent transporter DctM subunit